MDDEAEAAKEAEERAAKKAAAAAAEAEKAAEEAEKAEKAKALWKKAVEKISWNSVMPIYIILFSTLGPMSS